MEALERSLYQMKGGPLNHERTAGIRMGPLNREQQTAVNQALSMGCRFQGINMKKLTFRTMFGGPAIPPEYSKELYRIQDRLNNIEFSYDLDMSMNVGGDMVVITDPTGLRSVRITPSKKNAKGLIQLNSNDVLTAKNPAEFLRHSIHAAIMDLLGRIAKKDNDFNPEDSQQKIAFLLSDH